MSSSHVWDVPTSNLCAWWSSSPLEQSGQLEDSSNARDPGQMTCLVQMTDLGRMADLAKMASLHVVREVWDFEWSEISK